jgi:hypothetical protein|tara:strand:+ start:43 stop:426 length:384 start_codon:yes stop_codon:yes gene_type:complete
MSKDFVEFWRTFIDIDSEGNEVIKHKKYRVWTEKRWCGAPDCYSNYICGMKVNDPRACNLSGFNQHIDGLGWEKPLIKPKKLYQTFGEGDLSTIEVPYATIKDDIVYTELTIPQRIQLDYEGDFEDE